MSNIFDNILENSINIGLQKNFKNALEDAGVNVSESIGLWHYPDIIRQNLISKTVNGVNILGGDIINIQTTVKDDILTYNISTVFDSNGVIRPNYAPENSKWGENITVKDVFDDLFSNILPSVKGVYAGDMTITDLNGNDTKEWKHELFNQSGLKSGLEPTSRYIRLYLTCQQEPLYINIGNLIQDITNGYNVGNSDTVTFQVDDINNTLYAHINVITNNQLEELGIKTKK